MFSDQFGVSNSYLNCNIFAIMTKRKIQIIQMILKFKSNKGAIIVNVKEQRKEAKVKKSSHKYFISFILFVFLFWPLVSQLDFPLFSQTREKPLRHEVEVVLVEIPLYIVDKEGNPIKDLKPEELTLEENGKEQKITHFVLVQNDSPEIASVVREYPAARRQFLLFFDFAFATPGRIMMAREASLNFINEKIFPNDLVAVITYSAIGGLRIVSNFSNDRDHLFSVIDTLGLVKTKGRTAGPMGYTFPDFATTSTDSLLAQERTTGLEMTELGDAEFREILDRSRSKSERIYTAHVSDFVGELNKLSVALNAIKGRKHIILFSEGFDSKVLTGKSLEGLSRDQEEFAATGGIPSSDKESRFGDTGLRMKLYDALNLIASADCPVHTVDIGGLRSQAGSVTQVEGAARDLAAIRRGQETLTVLSRETGGQVYKNVNELDKPLENILKITNTYYILGYYPEDKRKEGKFRKIKVKTTRKDVNISYRKGYYETKPYKEYSNLEKRLQLVEYVVKDIPRNEIQFDSLVSVFRGKGGICQVPVFLKFPGTQFLKKKKVELEIYGYAISSAGIFRDFFHQTLTLSPQRIKKKLETNGVKYYDLHLLPPGDYKIRLIVRDSATGEIGTQFQEVSVPDYGQGKLAVSGPVFIQPGSDWVLSRGYDPNAPTGRKQGANLPVDYPYVLDKQPLVPGVFPMFSRSSSAQLYLRAYNLRLHPTSWEPQTEINFEVVDMEGKSTPLKNVSLLQKPTQPEPGVYDLLFQANFGEFESGAYMLKLIFKDSLANQEVTSQIPFIIQ